MSSADQIQQVEFPDINPADLSLNANFSMAAGDFLDVYTEPGIGRNNVSLTTLCDRFETHYYKSSFLITDGDYLRVSNSV